MHPLVYWLDVPFCSDAVSDPLESLSLSDICPPESFESIVRFVLPSVVPLLLLPPLHWRLAPELFVLPVTVNGMSGVGPALVFTQSLPEPLIALPLC